uniref:RNase H type-1 domain-containing protein n=1 Tax=Cannabis sativa TaxID=3483 RepID=A0A803QEP1_CANSA
MSLGQKNDSFFFLEASVASCVRLRETLHQYENASGQLVNLRKLVVCFSSSIPLDFREYLAHILGVSLVPCHDKFLGLPCFAGKSKSGLFQPIKDRIWNKLFGWKSKLFSPVGREVLLKSVIQAIPTYAMSLFRLSIGIINEIHRMCATFWCGGDDDKKKMHWCTWPRLCCHKNDGGMCFWDMFLFNQSLLAKQAARLYNSPDSLAARVMKGFYFGNGSLLTVEVTKRSSFFWKSILWGRDLWKNGCCWRVGSVESIRIREDVWIPKDHVGKTYSFSCGPHLQRDRLIWHFSDNGSFSVKSGYWSTMSRRNTFLHDHKLQSDNMVSAWAMDYLWKYQDANNVEPTSMGPVSSNASNRLASTETDLVLGEFNLFVDAKMGYTVITAFSDCQRVVLAVNSKVPYLNEFGIVLNDINHVRNSFSSISLSHCNWSKNHVAHSLAKRALSLDEVQVRWSGLPADLAV